jgi:hypothetical protein
MIPVGGHFEQFCNARDAVRSGAGIYDTEFKIDRLLDYIPEYKPSENYRRWIKGVEYDVLGVIDKVLPPTDQLKLMVTLPSFSSLSRTPSS